MDFHPAVHLQLLFLATSVAKEAQLKERLSSLDQVNETRQFSMNNTHIHTPAEVAGEFRLRPSCTQLMVYGGIMLSGIEVAIPTLE